VKRRAFLAAVSLVPMAVGAIAASARAQATSATQTQIDLALAFISLAALRTRYGEAHADVTAARARALSLSASLRAAIARHETIDVAVVTSALDAELADVRARLAEFSQRCGSGHPDMQSAHARAAALEDAIAHVTSEGAFFPAP
jgi:uncharacterized protein involved in exopolysaccharide biosynthesis